MTLTGGDPSRSVLRRAYFAESLKVESESTGSLVLVKEDPLPAERDRGLERWSFCIPVGPEDATGLNAMVRRILEIDVAEKEIILCGRPAENFAFFDRVRIIGEDITAPPVQICRKKNLLAKEARFENLCILHDRVFLPRSFGAAMREFGDLFPFATMQSIFFDDRHNFVPRRYSDYNRRERPLGQALGFTRDRNGTLSGIIPGAFELVENALFVSANPLNYHQSNYATGSMYICKRSVWEQCPQDEALYWTEFEDVEQGLRASALGIPSRVVPKAFTQSVYARPLLSFAGRVHFESVDRRLRNYRSISESWPLKRKPLLKLTDPQARARLEAFARKYVPLQDLARVLPDLPRAARSSRERTSVIARILTHARVSFDHAALTAFVEDFEKLIMIDQLPYGDKRHFVQELHARNPLGKLLLLDLNHWYRNQIAQRPGVGLFYHDIREYFPKRGLLATIGTWFSAYLLNRRNGKLLYHPDGFTGYVRAIRDSTPWVDYCESGK